MSLVQIYGNNSLENVDGLSNLTTLNEGLALQSNNGLTSIQGLSNLTFTGGLQIQDNASLCESLVEELVEMLDTVAGEEVSND